MQWCVCRAYEFKEHENYVQWSINPFRADFGERRMPTKAADKPHYLLWAKANGQSHKYELLIPYTSACGMIPIRTYVLCNILKSSCCFLFIVRTRLLCDMHTNLEKIAPSQIKGPLTQIDVESVCCVSCIRRSQIHDRNMLHADKCDKICPVP